MSSNSIQKSLEKLDVNHVVLIIIGLSVIVGVGSLTSNAEHSGTKIQITIGSVKIAIVNMGILLLSMVFPKKLSVKIVILVNTLLVLYESVSENTIVDAWILWYIVVPMMARIDQITGAPQ